MLDAEGDEVRSLVEDRPVKRNARVRLKWDGRDDDGRGLPDGTYFVRIVLRKAGRSVTSPRSVLLDTTPPQPKLVGVTPARVSPGGPRSVTIRYDGPTNPAPVFSVFRTAASGEPKLVDRFNGTQGSDTGVWDGRDRAGQ